MLIWMKQSLIWLNLQRDGTRNGLSNIKETFEENLQLQISVLHQNMSIYLPRLVSQVQSRMQYDGWAKSSCILQAGSFSWDLENYSYLFLVLYLRHQTIYMCWILFICKESTSCSYRKYKPVRITQKEHLLIWNSETTQKPKHLSS